jgi:hypothetical protein
MRAVENNQTPLDIPVPRIARRRRTAAIATVAGGGISQIFGPCIAELSRNSVRQPFLHLCLERVKDRIVVISVQRYAAELRVHNNEVLRQFAIPQQAAIRSRQGRRTVEEIRKR